MIRNIFLALIFISAAVFSGCAGKGQKNEAASAEEQANSAPDTGFTGIKKFYSKDQLTYEATFKNGIRDGLMTTYYPSGKVRQTFQYTNGLREDTAIWYFEDGRIFRKTPFRGDSINGTQIQYYGSGRVRAKLEYVNGLRKPTLEEWDKDGGKITTYPDVVVKVNDQYAQAGVYTISLGVSKEKVKVNFYRGEFTDGLFAPKKLKKINTTDFTGSLQLTKSGKTQPSYVGIIAEISTALGNKLLVYKKVDLPYNDLN
ncbi:MAG: hypothetical protein U0X39_03835 [Bacteroidales bacterium]